jgi:undecaprenyl-diphosphatase
MDPRSPARVAALLLAGLAFLWLLGWGMGAIVHGVAIAQTFQLDRPVHNVLVDHRSAPLTEAMRALTFMGGSAVLVPVVLVMGVGWLRARHVIRPLLLLALGYGGSAALTDAIKAIVDRHRPPMADAVGHHSGASFPSGHALDSMVVYGALALLASGASRRKQAPYIAWPAALLLVAGIAFTRLYLGAHWLTDVLAGMVLGALWLAVVHAALPRPVAEPTGASPADRSGTGRPP